MNKIDQLISEMEKYIERCQTKPFSSKKIIVERGAIDDFLAELRMCIPQTIERSEKIIDNQNYILENAKKEAEEIINDANNQTSNLINEHEIVQQAIAQSEQILDDASQKAQEILNDAVREANIYKESAVSYVENNMAGLRHLYEENITSTKAMFENHLISMDAKYKDICENHDKILKLIQDTMPDINTSVNSYDNDDNQ